MDHNIEQLIYWLNASEKFFLNGKVRVIDTPAVGRCAILQKPKMCKNEVLMSVPSSHQLNYQTVVYWMSFYNRELTQTGLVSLPDGIKLEKSPLREKLYGMLDPELMVSLTSFQLLSLYILAEWVLIPSITVEPLVTKESFWKPFFNVWPTIEELSSIPALCHESSHFGTNKKLISYLTSASRQHMERILKLIRTDWDVIFPTLNKWKGYLERQGETVVISQLYDSYLHIYFIINSRCLYCKIPSKENEQESNFTMVPYVDFLNHTSKVDVHCFPQIDYCRKSGYGVGEFTIKCGDYEYHTPGEEIFLNYGAHSNDFLLNEYGFALQNNEWDFIDVTKEIIDLTMENKLLQGFLQKHGYWGDYTIGRHDISYRTVVALSLIVTLDYNRVEKFINGYISEEFFYPRIKHTLYELLVSLRYQFQEKIEALNNMHHMEVSALSGNLLIIYSSYISIIDTHLEVL